MGARRYLAALAVVVTLGVGIAIGTIVSRGVRAARPFGGAPDAKPLPLPSPVELSSSFAKIAEAIEPAVVNINTESMVSVSRKKFSSPDEAPFDDFLDRLFRADGPQGDLLQQSLGSGVILDKSGYVLTNYHVVMRDSEDKPVDRILDFVYGDEHLSGDVAEVVGQATSTDLTVVEV